jgi:amidase
MSKRHPLRMNRRNALKATTVASAGAFLQGTGLAHAGAGFHAVPGFTYQEGAVAIEEVPVSALREALDAGEFSIRELVQACLDRIDAFDQRGPNLNAVIELNGNALTLADELDAELAAGNSRGMLHGIPVLIKDNIATADGMENTAGSLALVGAKPTKDAFIVTRLRDAGAVILGKTNLSEWANIRSFWSTSGWSGRGGQTVNPYVLDRNASGSSTGSAVAVAASYVPIAVGTETNGSIVSPASHCGIVGLKPTVGLVSRSGIIPISHSQDSAGPMGRTVMCVATLLNALAAPDPADPAQAESAATPVAGATPATPGDAAPPPGYPAKPEGGVPTIDYVAQLMDDGLQGARIGVLRGAAGFSPASDRVFAEAIAVLTGAGAEVIDPVEIPTREEVESSPDGLEVLLWELKPGLAAYLEEYTDPAFPIRTLEDIIRFNNEHADVELRYFDQSLFDLAAAKSDLSDEAYLAAAGTLQHLARTGIDAVMDEHQLDAIIAPANGPATKIDLINGDHWLGGTSTMTAVAGYPILTVNAGYHFGLPVGVNFMGKAWSEATLLRLGHAFEQAAQTRQPPQYVPGSVIPEGNETPVLPEGTPEATPVATPAM